MDTTIEYIHKMGDKIKMDAMMFPFALIKKYDTFRAITATCTKGLMKSIIILLLLMIGIMLQIYTGNLIMPKEQYYLLQELKAKFW